VTRLLVAAAVLAVVPFGPARADTDVSTQDQPAEEPVLEPTQFDPSTCKELGAEAEGAEPAVPVGTTGFEVLGELRDSLGTVRALFDPLMARNRALTRDARTEIRASAAGFGYYVVGLGTRDTADGPHAILHLAPLPLVRRVHVKIKPQLEDELRRRLRLRTGVYLPWPPQQRACELYGEQRRLEEFLHDEGYFDARVQIAQGFSGIGGIDLTIDVKLGSSYTIDIDHTKVVDASGSGLAVPSATIKAQFRKESCFLYFICSVSTEYRRATFQESLKKIVDLFHRSQYPSVRVRTSDPVQGLDRRNKKISFLITIDPRRRVQVVFENAGSIPLQTLHDQLTFDDAQSADDLEANNSAAALTTFLQSKGFFDAHVTWTRESFAKPPLDNLIFRLDLGHSRVVREVTFMNPGVFSTDELKAAIGTRKSDLSNSLFGNAATTTAALLAGDEERLRQLYRRNGYLGAQVRVTASPDPAGLDSAALASAFVLSARGSGLYVRFAIDQGPLTVLRELHVDVGDTSDQIATPAQRELCKLVLTQLAELTRHAEAARLAAPDRCVAVVGSEQHPVAFKDQDLVDLRDRLKDRLFTLGRPRAEVTYAAVALAPQRMAAHFKVLNTQPLVLGKVVIRGNFRTRASIIRGELRLREGAPLTKERLAESARRLRSTALFDAVNIELPDLDYASAGGVNAVVSVTERYDYRASIEFETGYSSLNGLFVSTVPALRNLFGLGMSLELNGTIGVDPATLPVFGDGTVKLKQLGASATYRIPSFLWRQALPYEFETALTAFRDQRDTPRFGPLLTTGASVSLSHVENTPRVGRRPAHVFTWGPRYDFRIRQRNVDALRPIGADEDDSQVPITTRTGLVSVEANWEQRVDRNGVLSPLAPEDGFRLDAQAGIASTVLLGQDNFLKFSGSATRYIPLGNNLVLRGDLRYDHGIPLGTAVLLPEVERFFAGGDATVRGYDDDRMATEVIQVGVPPFDNLQQIRVLPAGGNIRVMASLDAQLRIYKILATAVFADAGLITNQWTTANVDDVRPSVGVALARIVTPFGSLAIERAVPLRPQLGDDPRGRWHFSFAARATF
jgi:outer membrane protein assembly factor BamA